MSPNSENPEENLGKFLLGVGKNFHINYLKTENPVSKDMDLEHKANIPDLKTNNIVEEAKDLEHIVIKNGGENLVTIKTIISNNKNLKSLNLICSNINDSQLSDIIESLAGNVNLETLNFRQNQIGDDGVKELLNKISQFPNLKTIDLSENQIGDVGVKELKDAVFKKDGLKINIGEQKPGSNPTNPLIKNNITIVSSGPR